MGYKAGGSKETERETEHGRLQLYCLPICHMFHAIEGVGGKVGVYNATYPMEVVETFCKHCQPLIYVAPLPQISKNSFFFFFCFIVVYNKAFVFQVNYLPLVVSTIKPNQLKFGSHFIYWNHFIFISISHCIVYLSSFLVTDQLESEIIPPNLITDLPEKLLLSGIYLPGKCFYSLNVTTSIPMWPTTTTTKLMMLTLMMVVITFALLHHGSE